MFRGRVLGSCLGSSLWGKYRATCRVKFCGSSVRARSRSMFRVKSRVNSRVKFRVDSSDDSRAESRVNSRSKFRAKLLGSSQWPSLGSKFSVKF